MIVDYQLLRLIHVRISGQVDVSMVFFHGFVIFHLGQLSPLYRRVAGVLGNFC